jgi:FK506-binding nuclear protein
MASVDPNEEPSPLDKPYSTLKVIRNPLSVLDDEDDEDDESDSEGQGDIEDEVRSIRRRLGFVGSDDEDEEEDSDSDGNGGPSDPSKIKKAHEAAFKKSLKEAAEEMDLDEELHVNGNGINGKKGKGRALHDHDDEDDESDEGFDVEEHEFVLCTLDTTKAGR